MAAMPEMDPDEFAGLQDALNELGHDGAGKMAPSSWQASNGHLSRVENRLLNKYPNHEFTGQVARLLEPDSSGITTALKAPFLLKILKEFGPPALDRDPIKRTTGGRAKKGGKEKTPAGFMTAMVSQTQVLHPQPSCMHPAH